ncbi:MAG: DUF3108 domain-containing protein [Oligoflexia bacterium]|nr:DUF3108 domain-containing protein [Oligoflexia bacterium]
MNSFSVSKSHVSIFIINLLFFIFLFVSCAGHNTSRPTPEQIAKKDLLNEFSVGDDYLKKFREKQVAPIEVLSPTSPSTPTQTSVSEVAEGTALIPGNKIVKTANKNNKKSKNKTKKLNNNKKNKIINKEVKETKKFKEIIKGVKGVKEVKEIKEVKEVKEVKEIKEVKNEKVNEKITLDNSYPEKYPDLFKEYDRNSVSVWRQFSPRVFIGEVIELAVKYFGITCGTVTLKTLPNVRIGNNDAVHLYARGKSAEFYESFYAIDDYVETFVDAKNFTPIKYTLIQRESKQSIDDLQLFDMDKLQTLYWFKREKKDEVSKEEKKEFIPKLLADSFAILYFMRGLPLKIGDSYDIPVVTRAEVWILRAKVAEEEEITIKGIKYKALKIAAETHFPGVLKKRGDIYFWYSNDSLRIPLKFMAKVKIGKVEGELLKYIGGNSK